MSKIRFLGHFLVFDFAVSLFLRKNSIAEMCRSFHTDVLEYEYLLIVNSVLLSHESQFGRRCGELLVT